MEVGDDADSSADPTSAAKTGHVENPDSTPPTETGSIKTPDPSSTTTGRAPGATQTVSSGDLDSGSGLSAAEIIGIVLGFVSALATTM
jgi:hypothetical protein